MPTLDSLPPRLIVLSQNRYSCAFLRLALMLYRIEQRIHTLSENVVDSVTTRILGFTAEGIRLSPWLRNGEVAWRSPYWLATYEVEANDYMSAWRQFVKSLVPLVSRVALVSQCYTEHLGQPILIERNDLKVAFVLWILDRERATGLMFMKEEKRALDLLLGHPDIPKEFFYYWLDAVNTFGYSSRLLLMLSAVEALTGIPYAERKGPKRDAYYQRLEQILGKELKEIFWGTKDDHTNALRHRLTHGEYFDSQDMGDKDYRGLLHSRIMEYFNEAIFKEPLLNSTIVNAPRHPYGNADQAINYLRARDTAKLCLIDVLADADLHGIENLVNYEYVWDNNLRENF
jgi:hypothetical protein